MVHSAYDSFELLTDCPTKIEAIESYGSKLLLGCSDGSLRIYGPDSSVSFTTSDRSPPSDFHAPSSSSDLRRAPYALERNVAGFSRKPLISMEVLDSRELLLSLSESIAFHRLPNLETVAVLTKAKGANVYSWDERRGFLCFARQKKVCIFRHDGKTPIIFDLFGVNSYLLFQNFGADAYLHRSYIILLMECPGLSCD